MPILSHLPQLFNTETCYPSVHGYDGKTVGQTPWQPSGI
jgi:hypothetical protein